MLSKKNRIKKRNDFNRIFKKGESAKSNLFVFKVLKNGINESRFAVVVSQKVSKKAVVRNKIRRRVAAVIAENLKKIKPGIDLVIVTLPKASEASLAETKQLIFSAINKLGLVNKC